MASCVLLWATTHPHFKLFMHVYAFALIYARTHEHTHTLSLFLTLRAMHTHFERSITAASTDHGRCMSFTWNVHCAESVATILLPKPQVVKKEDILNEEPVGGSTSLNQQPDDSAQVAREGEVPPPSSTLPQAELGYVTPWVSRETDTGDPSGTPKEGGAVPPTNGKIQSGELGQSITGESTAEGSAFQGTLQEEDAAAKVERERQEVEAEQLRLQVTAVDVIVSRV